MVRRGSGRLATARHRPATHQAPSPGFGNGAVVRRRHGAARRRTRGPQTAWLPPAVRRTPPSACASCRVPSSSAKLPSSGAPAPCTQTPLLRAGVAVVRHDPLYRGKCARWLRRHDQKRFGETGGAPAGGGLDRSHPNPSIPLTYSKPVHSTHHTTLSLSLHPHPPASLDGWWSDRAAR